VTQAAARGQAKVWLLSMLGLVLIWTLAATFIESRALPSPLDVFQALLVELRSGELLFHLSATLLRVLAAFVIAMLIGSAIGIALGRSASLNYFFDPWVILFLNIPALVIIVLAYLWYGLNEVAAIGAVALNKIPNVIVTVSRAGKQLAM